MGPLWFAAGALATIAAEVLLIRYAYRLWVLGRGLRRRWRRAYPPIASPEREKGAIQ